MKKPIPLFDESKYQAFLMTCPCTLPVSFANHNWFVVNKKGSLSRWEAGIARDRGDESWGHLRKNDPGYSIFGGIYVFPFSSKHHWSGSMRFAWEGEEARRLIEIIEKSPNLYPYCHKYSPFGPNSNTFIQWVIKKSKQEKSPLSFNSIGKNYNF